MGQFWACFLCSHCAESEHASIICTLTTWVGTNGSNLLQFLSSMSSAWLAFKKITIVLESNQTKPQTTYFKQAKEQYTETVLAQYREITLIVTYLVGDWIDQVGLFLYLQFLLHWAWNRWCIGTWGTRVPAGVDNITCSRRCMVEKLAKAWSRTDACHSGPDKSTGALSMYCRFWMCGLSKLFTGFRREHTALTGADMKDSWSRYSKVVWSHVWDKSKVTEEVKVSNKQAMRYRSIGGSMVRNKV